MTASDWLCKKHFETTASFYSPFRVGDLSALCGCGDISRLTLHNYGQLDTRSCPFMKIRNPQHTQRKGHVQLPRIHPNHGTPDRPVLDISAGEHRVLEVDHNCGYVRASPWTAVTRSDRAIRQRAARHGRPWADPAAWRREGWGCADRAPSRRRDAAATPRRKQAARSCSSTRSAIRRWVPREFNLARTTAFLQRSSSENDMMAGTNPALGVPRLCRFPGSGRHDRCHGT
jgi:hypothetical protein